MAHYKFFLLILFISINSFLYSQKYPVKEVDFLLQNGIEYIINHEYENAKNIFDQLDKKYPNIPLGKIYLAAVEITKAYDYAEEFNEEYIASKLNEASLQADSLLEKDQNNVWYNYFSALAAGYFAYLEALNEDWLNAIAKGISSINSFEKCLSLNPQFYESNIAIGSFKYWKSRKFEFLDWLPFVNDEKDEGIGLLEKSIEKSTYNRYLAINFLTWIYIDLKDFNNAIRIAEAALKKNPDCRTIKWGLARAYEEIDKKKSIKFYYEILNSYPQAVFNQYNEILLKHIIAQQYYKLGEDQKALILCNEILTLKNLNGYVKNKLGNRLLRVKELQAEILK